MEKTRAEILMDELTAIRELEKFEKEQAVAKAKLDAYELCNGSEYVKEPSNYPHWIDYYHVSKVETPSEKNDWGYFFPIQSITIQIRHEDDSESLRGPNLRSSSGIYLTDFKDDAKFKEKKAYNAGMVPCTEEEYRRALNFAMNVNGQFDVFFG